jgi:predicted glycosyltransferase
VNRIDPLLKGNSIAGPPQELTLEKTTFENPSRMKHLKPHEGAIARKKVWIDLDNSPHVPFFLPIIEELRKRGHEVFLTGRDSYQVCQLLELNHLSCEVIGGHWGKNRLLKMFGTCTRALRLIPVALREKPDLAISHGSRAQLIASAIVRIPTLMICDYEFSAGVGFFHPDWAFIPKYISGLKGVPESRLLKYPGLKEDVYVPRFQPNLELRSELGLTADDLVVTLRPPATEAHYHNPEAEVLFDAAMELLLNHPKARVVLLPRNEKQDRALRKVWGKWMAKKKIVVPEHAVDGLNLLWCSDFVISGGGTMNREAAALGVPVYSIFRGQIGAVDTYLAESGRLVLIESAEDVLTKIRLERNDPASRRSVDRPPVLDSIVDGIVSIMEHQCLQEHH